MEEEGDEDENGEVREVSGNSDGAKFKSREKMVQSSCRFAKIAAEFLGVALLCVSTFYK